MLWLVCVILFLASLLRERRQKVMQQRTRVCSTGAETVRTPPYKQPEGNTCTHTWGQGVGDTCTHIWGQGLGTHARIHGEGGREGMEGGRQITNIFFKVEREHFDHKICFLTSKSKQQHTKVPIHSPIHSFFLSFFPHSHGTHT